MKVNKVERHTLPEFKIYDNTTVFKIIPWCYEDRYINQRDRIGSLEISPYMHCQLIFHKDTYNSMG